MDKEEVIINDSKMEQKKVKYKNKVFFALVIVLIINLIVGIAGGMVGYALLANSELPVIQKIRTAFKLDDAAVSLPLKQSIQIEESSAVIDAVNRVMPAVVSISATQQVSDFFGRVSNQQTSGGSGFILTSDGLIVTNKHVVASTGQYSVVLNDGRTFAATIQAKDTYNDLAILKIDAKDLPVVEIGSSNDLQVGQYVIAIGNALGEYKNSVTTGVVSAKQRTLNASSDTGSSENLTGLIQTDASINPGNSGGPLLNAKGQVVGINTAIATTTGASVGIGFAIGIDTVKNALDSVRKTGEIIRPMLGVRYIPVTTRVKELNNLSVDYGALVSQGSTAEEVAVMPGSAADKAGVQANDIILEVNGDRIDETTSLTQLIGKYNVGDIITLKIQRKGENIELKATLEKMQ